MSDPHASPEAAVTRLADWTPYPFRLTRTRLEVALAPRGTVVRSTLEFAPVDGPADLVLDGGAGLRTRRMEIDGTPVRVTPEGERLTIPAADLPSGPFTLTAEVEIDPEANTTLEGLYLSNGMFCTQCEAEGFRHITWYPDRPDVMAPFEVRVTGDAPVLLSNGNPVASGEGWTEWHDPWPKPAYLFALVAGTLEAVSDRFTTASGREVALNVWVRPGDLPRAGFAMEALKRSMAWDERVYGREYDLDMFNIVAVSDFNMGAMENKGLNIFNAALVLASPETATDADYARIEAVIAHEYFHNWTGNRITCRDWFQLCLKEGLTVFRDQQYQADLGSAAVKRIEDVKLLRRRQFTEDLGPLAHPPRPSEYREINNFYTATVYEKGAEVIGMLKRLVGDDGYAKALDLYFDRHDGQACTIEDWLAVFDDATGRDLAQFKHWYVSAGTPEVTLEEAWAEGEGADDSGGTLTLTLSQSTAPTPGEAEKAPRVIPIAVGLIGPNGDEVRPTETLELTEATQSWRFEGLGARPVVSALRGFSAPVILHHADGKPHRAFRLAHDADPFARWEAGHGLAIDALLAGAEGAAPDAAYVDAIGTALRDDALEPAFLALVLTLPLEDELAAVTAGHGRVPDPDALHAAREALATALATAHGDRLRALVDAMATPGAYSPDPEPVGRRSLRLAALALLSRVDGGRLAAQVAAEAGNMTERLGALAILVRHGDAAAELARFEADFAGNALVMDKWFAVQVSAAPPAQAVSTARRLAAREDFAWKNPNRFRALLGALAGNHAAFHAADGSGYAFAADWIGRVDGANPQIAARMSQMFETWHRYDAGRQAQAQAALGELAGAGRSRNLSEMVARMRSAG